MSFEEDEVAVEPKQVMYELTYDSGAGLTVWRKTLEELLMPNGDESLLDWMLHTSEEQGRGVFTLERLWWL